MVQNATDIPNQHAEQLQTSDLFFVKQPITQEKKPKDSMFIKQKNVISPTLCFLPVSFFFPEKRLPDFAPTSGAEKNPSQAQRPMRCFICRRVGAAHLEELHLGRSRETFFFFFFSEGWGVFLWFMDVYGIYVFCLFFLKVFWCFC